MLGTISQSMQPVAGLAPATALNSAGATTGWIDVRGAEGEVIVTAMIGLLTAGSLTWTIEHAINGSGAGAATITPIEGAFAAGATNQIQKRSVLAKSTAGFIRLVGTLVTGPALVASCIHYRPKNF